MRPNAKLGYAEVSLLIRYEPETGLLFWLPRPREKFRLEVDWLRWNCQQAGREALGAVNIYGYKSGYLGGRTATAHRVAWLLTTGDWPNHQIDHIDGDRQNNRLVNLRDVTQTENQHNRKRQSDNTSGINGVCWHVRRQTWQARIKVGGRQIQLGSFRSLQDAATARKAANDRYGFTQRHGT